MSINYFAVVVAAIAAFLVGAAWYGVLGKPWMAALGKSSAECANRKMPVAPMVVSFVALLVMSFMLAGLIGHLTAGRATVAQGAITGAACWVAFVLTTMVVNNAFQQRRPMLTVIDGGHWLAVLVVEGVIIGAFG